MRTMRESMFTRFIKFIGTLLLISSMPLSANIINVIDFTGNNEGVAEQFAFTENGVTLTISAWTTNVNSNQDVLTQWQLLSGQYGVYKGSSGLGVRSNGQDGSYLDGGQSNDFTDLDEGLLFSFSEEINILGFYADYLDAEDDLNFSLVKFLTPTSIETTDIFIDQHASLMFDEEGVYFAPDYLKGSTFMIWADGNDDAVRIVDTAFVKVTEPNTLLLFSLIIIGLAFRRSV